MCVAWPNGLGGHVVCAGGVTYKPCVSGLGSNRDSTLSSSKSCMRHRYRYGRVRGSSPSRGEPMGSSWGLRCWAEAWGFLAGVGSMPSRHHISMLRHCTTRFAVREPLLSLLHSLLRVGSFNVQYSVPNGVNAIRRRATVVGLVVPLSRTPGLRTRSSIVDRAMYNHD